MSSKTGPMGLLPRRASRQLLLMGRKRKNHPDRFIVPGYAFEEKSTSSWRGLRWLSGSWKQNSCRAVSARCCCSPCCAVVCEKCVLDVLRSGRWFQVSGPVVNGFNVGAVLQDSPSSSSNETQWCVERVAESGPHTLVEYEWLPGSTWLGPGEGKPLGVEGLGDVGDCPRETGFVEGFEGGRTLKT